MRDGTTVAVNPERTLAINCNMAMAGGHDVWVYNEHRCGNARG